MNEHEPGLLTKDDIDGIIRSTFNSFQKSFNDSKNVDVVTTDSNVKRVSLLEIH